MSSHQCSAFDPELESVQEFFQRFQVQNSDLLHKFRNDDAKKASLLIKALPVSIISDLQRRLSPVLLTDASYDDIHDNLLQQFSSQKSTIGSSVQFLTCKQQHRQSFEEYVRQLNSLASPCNYPSTCLDRLLRDTFVAGISNSAILSSLIQVCDQLSFRETVERAKLLETYRQDVDSIRSTRLPATHTVHAAADHDCDGATSPDCTNKVSSRKPSVEPTYLCYRCGSVGLHLGSDCFAKTYRCHLCNKVGHLAKICQKTKSRQQPQRESVSSRRPPAFSHSRQQCHLVDRELAPPQPARPSSCCHHGNAPRDHPACASNSARRQVVDCQYSTDDNMYSTSFLE